MNEELKACPFCGGEAEIERVGTARMSTIYCCTECSCRLETGETFNHGALWNRRAMPNQGGEAVGWHTDDHLTDKSATTYDPEVAKRWRAKGWPVTPLYTHPADQVADGVVVSRERLEHWADKLGDSESNGYGWEDALAAELRALLNGGRDE